MPPRVPVPPVHKVLSRFVRLLQTESSTIRQSGVALLASSAGGLVAGLTLGAMSGTLERLPGLIILVPVAIGMRGNIFGALGSRLGTAIHTGQFAIRQRGGVVSQNIAAATVLTLFMSFTLAVLARLVAQLLGIETISVVELVVISVVGGVLSSVVVLALTLGIAFMSVKRNWDMDNVSAPLITMSGDIVTLPALYAATFIIVWPAVTGVLAAAALAAAFGSLLWAATRRNRGVMKRILAETVPVLMLAGTFASIAGVTLDRRIESLFVLPALFAIVPGFLESSGALGSILSARLASKLHLGIIRPRPWPEIRAAEDVMLTYMYAVVVYTVLGFGIGLATQAVGLAGPGLAMMVLLALIAGVMAATGAILVAYYGAIVTFRYGLDPDNYGIPIVTSSIDMFGVLSLVVAMAFLGIL